MSALNVSSICDIDFIDGRDIDKWGEECKLLEILDSISIGRETEIMCNQVLIKFFGKSNVKWFNEFAEFSCPNDCIVTIKFGGAKIKYHLIEAKTAKYIGNGYAQFYLSHNEYSLMKRITKKHNFYRYYYHILLYIPKHDELKCDFWAFFIVNAPGFELNRSLHLEGQNKYLMIFKKG